MDTSQPEIASAEVYQFNLDKVHEEQAEAFCERVHDEMHSFETFLMFLHDIDPDAPELQAFHGCLDEDQNTKVFGYDTFMNMYEEYVTSWVEV